jgi:hypothetical protein
MVVTDAARWEVDTETDASEVRYGILWKTAGKGVERSGIHPWLHIIDYLLGKSKSASECR